MCFTGNFSPFISRSEFGSGSLHAKRPLHRVEDLARACCRASSAGRAGAWGSLDDLVGAANERERDREPERLCGLEVDDQLDFHRLLNRQVTQFGTFENSPCVDAHLPIGISKVRSIAHQAARSSELAIRINRGKGMTRREHDELIALVREK